MATRTERRDPYTADEDAHILRRWDEGATYPMIAGELGRSIDGVRMRGQTLKKRGGAARSVAAVDPFDPIDAPATPAIPPRLTDDATDEDLWDYLERGVSARQDREQPAITVERDLGNQPVALLFMSDVHIGGGGVDLQRFRADCEYVRDAGAAARVVFNGDLWENTKPQSKSGTALYTAQFANGKEQYDYSKSRAAIMVANLLVIGSGNHDAFDFRHAGVDRLEMLARELGVPYASERGVTLRLTVGGCLYVVVAKHDYRGKSQLNKANSQRRLWDEWPHEWDNADIVALAHLHEPLHEVVQRKGRDVVYLRSGTYKVQDAWAESNGYKPSYGVGCVVLFPGERKLIPFPATHWRDGVEYAKSLR